MTIDIRTLLLVNMYVLYIRKELIHCTPQTRNKWKQIRMELVVLFALITEKPKEEIIQNFLYDENIIEKFDADEKYFSKECYDIHKKVKQILDEEQESSTEDKLSKIEETLKWLKINCV